MSAISAISAGGTPAATGVGQASPELKETFQKTVAGLIFGQMLKSMRDTVGKPAYIHGGQAEDLFQSQLDQLIVERLAEERGGPFVGDLYQQFLTNLKLQDESSPSSQATGLLQPSGESASRQLSELSESSRQAQPALDGAQNTIGTTGLSALLRK